MKKITFLCVMAFSFVFTSGVIAQTLNQNANWPNGTWALTGTYSAAAGALEADPTVDANFAFDDDDAGAASDDTISAESPVIDLTAAFGAGETHLTVDVDYVYRKFSVEEFLRFQYYDADGMTWVNWEPDTMPGNDVGLTDEFCLGTPLPYTTVVLDIAGFTANQQSGFRYRISFDDDPNGPAYEYGFCLNSPIITSATPPTCTVPVATAVLVENCAGGTFTVDVDVTSLGDATSLTISNDAGVASTAVGATGMYSAGPFPNYTAVNLVLEHDQDNVCNLSLGSFVDACPVPNDECANAIDLDPFSNADGSCTMTYLGSNLGATNSAGEVAPSGACVDGDPAPADVWFTLTVPLSGQFDFDFVTNPGFSTLVELYTGTCGALVALDPVECGNGATRTFTGLTPSDTVYLRVWDYGSDDEGDLEICINYLNCTPATVAYNIESDCDNSGGFNIVVDITDMGSSTSIDIDDDQGSATQSTGVTGMFTFGPFVNGTDVVISLTDNDDNNCSQDSGALTQVACPPANDDCSGAIALTPGVDFAANPIDGSVLGATLGAETNDCGLNGPGVWYSVVIPADGNITIETGPDMATANGLFDSVVEAYSGACGGLTLIECDDDDAVGAGNFSLLELTGLTPGETIYLRVWEYGGDESEPFAISAYNATLSTTEFDNENSLKYFPNPVKNVLTLKALQNIQSVSVLNILGQEVLRTTPNALENELDLSNLNIGSYFVKVTINDITETIRIIKD